MFILNASPLLIFAHWGQWLPFKWCVGFCKNSPCSGHIKVTGSVAAFLDVPHSLALFKLLKRIAQEENKGVLISTHQVEHALRYADRLLVFLKNGNVYSGKKEELLNKGAT